MFILRNGEKLQVLLGGAVNATELPITVKVEDAPDSKGGRSSTKTIDAITTGATEVNVVIGQKSGREIKAIAIYNADNTTATVTVRFYASNATTRIIYKVALATGETLHYAENRGWYVTDVNGAQKVTSATDASTADSKAESAATRASTALSAATSLDTATDTAYSTADSTERSKADSADTSLNAALSAVDSANLSSATSLDVAQSTNVSAALSAGASAGSAASVVQSNETRQSTDQSTMRSLLASGGQAGF